MMTFANNFTGQEHNFDCKDIYIENYIFVLLEFLANVHKCSLDAITQMLLGASCHRGV